MSKNSDLINTLIELKKEKYPELPEALILSIVQIESDFSENRSEAIKRIEEEVDIYLKRGEA
jgi:hypothetical protein